MLGAPLLPGQVRITYSTVWELQEKHDAIYAEHASILAEKVLLFVPKLSCSRHRCVVYRNCSN